MKRILIYLAVTFTLTWGLWAVAVSGPVVIGAPVVAQLTVGLGMFCPAIGALVTWLICRKKQPFDIPIRPRFRGNGKYYALAWFAPTAFAVLGGVLYFLIFPAQFDTGMGYVKELSAAQGAVLTQQQLVLSMVMQVVMAIGIAPLLNLLNGAGEEIGWRGLLYPALREKLSPTAACLVGGVIWGLWHAPLTMRGHNYGLDYPGFPWLGIVVMCVFCIALGTLLHLLTEKTGSIWPAALAHGAINAIGGIPLLFLSSTTTGSRLLGPAPSGLLGVLPLLACAAVLLWRHKRGEKRGKRRDKQEKWRPFKRYSLNLVNF